MKKKDYDPNGSFTEEDATRLAARLVAKYHKDLPLVEREPLVQNIVKELLALTPIVKDDDKARSTSR